MSELYGSMVFNDEVMSKRLPKATYAELKRCCALDLPLPLEVANVIANEMKEWAIEKGVTHFTHWFQPMTGITAEKHDSFITPTKDGKVIMELRGKELIKGEPDASSFPNGGLRSTFEARGYTAWDPTSYAFIKDGILCIPTAFCSYNGDALDKKTPLLRSMEAINKQGVRLLRLFGRKTERLNVTVGSEQEYFLIDTSIYEKRKDLFYTGRTLFGARPPKGQELDDHYFGAIKPRVVKYMKELDEELWKLGILAKTKHNEVAPAQHEFAPIYTEVNVASDQNQLTMEMMKKVAAKHGMTCLLHEKPFGGVNGSGKHNNWSLSTNFGHNLFEPGRSPQDNAQFLLILSAVIAAVDKHQDLLRIAVASAGNDHRLGANEAPPAIVSMFLGDELTGILQAIADGRTFSTRANCEVKLGVHVLPKFAMDRSDRNRTSPFAFTGNKFEFRMPGSAQSIAGVNVVLNTILAEQFEEFADELEKADDLSVGISKIIKRVMDEHGRIIFNGNNYSDEWVAEAERRGLLNLRTTVDALPYLTSEKNIKLFERQNVFTERELRSREEVYLETYCRLVNIEAMTMLDMANMEILPAVLKYKGELVRTAKYCKDIGISNDTEIEIAEFLSSLVETAKDKLLDLSIALDNAHKTENHYECGCCYRDEVLPAMSELRAVCDRMELNVAKEYQPFPNYGEILFSVH
ncbi:MAG: glutamine synthetase III [Bacteroides sp.]|nr:glutamine synthetase III [Bacillota bacterium]MCM1394208.1 glutamine synthetase III [[Eubacterium] siraeum]MCM1455822.1 glutamine synthetase III [Bacteroides sp.]